MIITHCYRRGKKQRLVWFLSPCKHSGAPGIQLKDAIIFFHITSHLPFAFTLQLYLHQLPHRCERRSDVWSPCGVSASVSRTCSEGWTLLSKSLHTTVSTFSVWTQNSFSSSQTQNWSMGCNIILINTLSHYLHYQQSSIFNDLFSLK